MDIYVYTPDFHLCSVVDYFTSVIWNERYFKYGDFQLKIPYKPDLYSIISSALNQNENCFAGIAESDTIMVIETIKIYTSAEEGNYLEISGRSLESILDRRIVYGQCDLIGNLQTGIKKIINSNIINPSNISRKIDGFIFTDSSDPSITSLSVQSQYFGDNVYSVIADLCESNKIGFQIHRTTSNQFEMKLYSGIDRSTSQDALPYVVFSKDFDNLLSSNYKESSEDARTVAVISGAEIEGYGLPLIEQEAQSSPVVGLSRREIHVDASSISREKDDGTEMSAFDYLEVLKNKGKEELVNHPYDKSFEAEVSPEIGYRYGRDFFMGDLITIRNEYGIEFTARVVEFIRSQDSAGYSEYPTFETVS